MTRMVSLPRTIGSWPMLRVCPSKSHGVRLNGLFIVLRVNKLVEMVTIHIRHHPIRTYLVYTK